MFSIFRVFAKGDQVARQGCARPRVSQTAVPFRNYSNVTSTLFQSHICSDSAILYEFDISFFFRSDNRKSSGEEY